MSTVAIRSKSLITSAGLRSKFTAVLVGASATATLYVGRSLLIPLGLAILLAFALAPMMSALRGLRLGRMLTVIVTILLASCAIGVVALFATTQFAELAAGALRQHAGGKMPILDAWAVPMPVWIAGDLAGPLMDPTVSAAVALLFTMFFLLNKDDLAGRVARFTSSSEIQRRSVAVGAAGREFGNYLLSQALIDVGFGAFIALGLWFLGVPSFGLWAVLGAMLRSVPLIGVPLAAASPLMLAATIDPTSMLICKILLLFIAVDCAARLIEHKVVRTTSVRLSAVAATAAAIGWTCLWGLPGLFLATPLTLAIVMLGRHFEPLHFLNRMLAGHPVSRRAASKKTVRRNARRSVRPAQGDAAMRALLQAQRELGACELDRERRVRIEQMIEGTLETPAPARIPRDESDELALRPWNLAPHWQGESVLSVAGPGAMDDAAAMLLAQALRRKGLTCRIFSFAEAARAAQQGRELARAQVVCLSCLDPNDYDTMRNLARDLRPLTSGARLIGGLWGWESDTPAFAKTLDCDLVAIHLLDAAEQIARLARKESNIHPIPTPAGDIVSMALAA